MKFDKETLKKEHFWFLLALVVPLVLIGFVLVMVTSAGPIQEWDKRIKDKETALKAVRTSLPKNQSWTHDLDIREKLVSGQKDKIWKKAWEGQEKLFTWPAVFPAGYLDQLGKMYFGDEIPDSIRAAFRDVENQTQLSPYQAEIAAIVDVAQPEIVQTPGSDWNALLRPVPKWNGLPTSEDLWLAQEDLWVQRGILQIVRDVNESAAALQPLTVGKDTVYVNSDWRVELKLDKTKGDKMLKYRLTNLSSQRQNLGFQLLVRYVGATQEDKFLVDGEPVAPGNSTKLLERKIPAAVASPSGIESVRQVFDWRTVPVKRIDRVELGTPALSHRQQGVELKAAKAFPLPSATDPSNSNAAPSPGLKNPGVITSATSSELPGGRRLGGDDVSANGLVRKRYLDSSDQVRRMPLGMVLIVDQAHVQDVLTAVANSPLRIQITQFHWSRYHGDIKPKEDETRPSETGERPVIAGESARPIPVRPPTMMPRPRFGFPREGMPPAGMQDPNRLGNPNQADEQEWDLVELAVYGIASLYERFPPREPKPSEPATKPGPTAPAPTTPAPSTPGTTRPAPVPTAPAPTTPGATQPAPVPPTTPPAAPKPPSRPG